MLTLAFRTCLRILIFRAGPEDFPYDTGHRLSFACIVLAVLANTLLTAVLAATLPTPPGALAEAAIGIVTVAAMGVFTRVALRARQLDNRFQQTFNALLATSSILTLAMVLPMQAVLPYLVAAQAFMEKLNANPDLARDPSAAPAFPGALLVVMMLMVWQFVVTSHIYRHAANTRTGGGILIALLCLLAIASFKSIVTALIG
jgi:hypothetical protein